MSILTILKTFMFKMSLLSLINFINIILIKNNVDLSTLIINCCNGHLIFNVDLNKYVL